MTLPAEREIFVGDAHWEGDEWLLEESGRPVGGDKAALGANYLQIMLLETNLH